MIDCEDVSVAIATDRMPAERMLAIAVDSPLTPNADRRSRTTMMTLVAPERGALLKTLLRARSSAEARFDADPPLSVDKALTAALSLSTSP